MPLKAGTYVSVALASGETDNFNPAPVGPPVWPGTYGRVDLDASAGAANLTGMVAGVDGQIVYLHNKPASGNTVTLNNLNGSSTAANQFSAFADTIIPPGSGVTAVYTAGSINKWVIFT